MGAPGTQARKPGTGQIRKAKGKYLALAPKVPGHRKEHRIGLYETKWLASRALEEWLRANAGRQARLVSPGSVVAIGAGVSCEVGAHGGGYAMVNEAR